MRRMMTVEYSLEDEEYERLVIIANEYRKQGLDLTPEKMFAHIMFTGSKNDKDEKFKFHEWKLGIRDDYK